MTNNELVQANSINEQLEVLNEFLKDNQRCWGILKLFPSPKSPSKQVTLKTSYGYCTNEITASKRLSASIIDAIKRELETLQGELDSIGK